MLFGRFISLSIEQPLKAPPLIWVIVPGSVTFWSCLHELNAYEFIIVTFSGIDTSVIPEFSNA